MQAQEFENYTTCKKKKKKMHAMWLLPINDHIMMRWYIRYAQTGFSQKRE